MNRQVFYGALISDGSLDTATHRFSLYNKQLEYVEYVAKELDELGMNFNSSFDKRYGRIMGYRCWSKRHPTLNRMYRHFYNGRKYLSVENVNRLQAEAYAHIWMCDGYLEHSKNRKLNKVQNIGWLCLESFPKEELEIMQAHLKIKFGINSSLVAKPWGFGYRIRIGGEDLQKFISMVYPYVLTCFKYKTILFYKNKDKCLKLPNMEQCIVEYTTIEDIVRHSQE